MTIAGSVARVARGVLGSVSWRAMPVAVRVLAAVLVAFLAVVVVQDLIAGVDTPSPVYEPLYNGVLVGSAVLCLARGVLGRSERARLDGDRRRPRAVGERQPLLAVRALRSRRGAVSRRSPTASGSAFLPVCYLGVLLLARKRMPQLDARLWLDGIIAALTTGAISAAVVFGAVHASTGGDTAAVATNLAYPLGDMILLGTVIGAMAAGRGRLDRSWLYFGAGIAVFAVTDSIYLLQIAKGTYALGTLLDIGWPWACC